MGMITASRALVRGNLETVCKPVRVSARTSRPQTVDVVVVVVISSSGCDFASNGSEGCVLVRGLEATVGDDSCKAAALYPLPLSDLLLPPHPQSCYLEVRDGPPGVGEAAEITHIHTPLASSENGVLFRQRSLASIGCSKRSFTQESLEVLRLNTSSLLPAKACVSTTGSQRSNPLSYFSKLPGVPETLAGQGLGLSLVHLASSWDQIFFVYLKSIHLNQQIASD